jgi:two-component system response regulator GlrR
MSEPGLHRENPVGTGKPGAARTGTAGANRQSGRRRSDRIVGSSRASQEAVDQAMAAAADDLPVRVIGPAGVGKKHLARALHTWSRRSSGPFEVLSCGAISEALLGRELFGCAAGVFPTLPEAHPGALQRAAGGTLVLDHIENLPSALRESLAKAMADRRYRREGDTTDLTLDARIVATSIEPLPRSPFGELPHHTVEVAPLAERSEDLLPLAAHFLRLYADEEGVETVGFTTDARTAIAEERWPGNVRELAERVQLALKLAGSGAISAEALLLSAEAEEVPSFKEAKRAFETRYVVGLLRRCGGNISRAARLAKKDRKDFYDVIRRTGVNPSDFR